MPGGRSDPLPAARGVVLARGLPHDFPPYDTVRDHFSRWQERDVWQEAVAALNTRWREEQPGRGRRAPKHAI